nr:ATP synthase F0 subunit 8 [Tachydromia umbrarum]
MPQMSPLSWLILYILFTMIFIMMCMINYFSYLPNNPQYTHSSKNYSLSMNWKW